MASALGRGSAGAMALQLPLRGDLAQERDLTPSQPYLARRPAIAQLARWPYRRGAG